MHTRMVSSPAACRASSTRSIASWNGACEAAMRGRPSSAVTSLLPGISVTLGDGRDQVGRVEVAIAVDHQPRHRRVDERRIEQFGQPHRDGKRTGSQAICLTRSAARQAQIAPWRRNPVRGVVGDEDERPPALHHSLSEPAQSDQRRARHTCTTHTTPETCRQDARAPWPRRTRGHPDQALDSLFQGLSNRRCAGFRAHADQADLSSGCAAG